MARSHFTPDLFEFLADLTKNNDREWFKANRDRYETAIREPFLDFIAGAGAALRPISRHLVADPRPVGGSLFRIHRDIRFARDKSPYKTHAGAHFRHAAGMDVHAPGFYLHLEPGGCFVAGGVWEPDARALHAIRSAIVERPAAWRSILRRAPALVGDSLVRAPQGFDPANPLVEDLKRKSYVASLPLTEAQVCAPGFMDDFAGACRSLSPLMRFLATALSLAW